MKKNDLVTLSTVALATATLCVAAFWSSTLEAGSERDVIPAKIAQPKLVVKGVEFTLRRVNAGEVAAGEEPVFELAALSKFDQTADLKVRVSMTTFSPASPMSRMVVMPTQIWDCEQSLVLRAGESKTFTLASHTKLPAGKNIAVILSEAVKPGAEVVMAKNAPRAGGGAASIAMLSFHTPGGQPVDANLPMAEKSLGAGEQAGLSL